MSDLISRKMVMKYLQEQQANVIIEKAKHGFVSEEVCDGMHAAVNAFINFIVQAPTIEAVPVVHGEWLKVKEWATKAKYRCSVCGREITSGVNVNVEKYPYCHCGAKMKGGAE